jgi:hypothetical protein
MPKFIGDTSTDERRRWLAEQMAGDPNGKTAKELAVECGVCVDTIYLDCKSTEFHTYIKSEIHKQAGGQVVAQAFRNVARAINKGDVKTSKWLIERLKIFDDPEAAEDWKEKIDAIHNGNGNGGDGSKEKDDDKRTEETPD